MRPNTTLRTWRAGGQTLGTWIGLANTQVAELMANFDFDWLCVDTQHGLVDYADLCNMLPAISTTDTTPFVRVPWNEPYVIMRALDAGAYGVVVPMINTAEDARRAVAACRYPPEGMRSYGPSRAIIYGGPDYGQKANDEIAVILMVETDEGLANVEEIAATPGVDCLFIGPSDLSLAVGLEPGKGWGEPAFNEAVAAIEAACARHGIAIGLYTHSTELAIEFWQRGYHMVDLLGDSRLLAAGVREALSAIGHLRTKPDNSTPELY